MARNPASLSKFDKMSVLGESAAVYPTPSRVYPQLHQLEVTSLLERPSLSQTWDRRRSGKRPRDAKEQYHNVSAAKKFVTEEMVATHLQHLNIASNQSPPLLPSAIPSSPSSLEPPSSQLSSAAPFLSSSDCSSLLASAAMSHPLNMRTVASCPRSLELTREDIMSDDETAMTDDGTTVLSTTRGATSSHTDKTGGTTDVRTTRLHKNPPWSQVGGRGCMDDDKRVKRRTSPLHKRLACELDEGGEAEEEEEEEGELELTGDDRSWSGLAGPHLKRSKVDLRIMAAATDSMNLDLLPDDPRMLIKSDSDTSSQSSSCDSDLSSLNGGKRWEPVILEDGSDSSDGGAEPGPERPLSLWVSPELQAISSNSCRVKHLLPPSILERYHSPKGMELVPWVGPPSALVRVEELDGEDNEDDVTANQQNGWADQNLDDTDTDISMEP